MQNIYRQLDLLLFDLTDFLLEILIFWVILGILLGQL